MYRMCVCVCGKRGGGGGGGGREINCIIRINAFKFWIFFSSTISSDFVSVDSAENILLLTLKANNCTPILIYPADHT